ncbi:MAG: N-6 DNA methylase [Promethearchaeota archaeon]
MHLNVLLPFIQEKPPMSIIPALPIKVQIRIIREVIQSLENSNYHKRNFYFDLFSQIRDGGLIDFLTQNGENLADNYWKYKRIGFFYYPRLVINELFTKKDSLTILIAIRNALNSDSIDWICLICQKSTFIFTLSMNDFLLWSPIIKGLVSYFLVSIFIDSSVLEAFDDTERRTLLEKEKSCLLRFMKHWFRKNTSIVKNKDQFVEQFFLQMFTFLYVQEELLDNLNDQLISFPNIDNPNDIEKINSHILTIFNKQDKRFTHNSFLEPSENFIYSSIVGNFTLADKTWILDIHPLIFLEIIPQMKNKSGLQKSGEYYTPITLAETIVFRTFEAFLLQDQKIPLNNLKVFDPAIGAGILLIFSLERLSNLILSRSYSESSFIDLRRKILQSCIYGQDINQDTIKICSYFLKLFCIYDIDNDKVLENLNRVDFFESFVKNIEFNKTFPKYDIILSNPPYLALHSRFTRKFPSSKELKIIRDNLPVFSGKRDNTYLIFLGICLKHYLTLYGVLGFVIDHSFLDLPSYRNIRKYLLQNYHLSYILAYYNYKKTAVVDLALIIINHIRTKKQTLWQESLKDKSRLIPQNFFFSHPNFIFKYQETFFFLPHLNKKIVPLGELASISCGLEYGGLLKTHFLASKREKGFYKCIDGSNGLPQPYILFWVPEQQNSYVRFDKMYEKNLQNTNQNVSQTGKKVIMISGNLNRFLTNKIILRQTASKFIGTIDEKKYLTLRNTHLIYDPKPPYSLFFILGILNSFLGNLIGEQQNIIRKPRRKSSRYPQIRLNDLCKFPIIDLNKLDNKLLVEQLENATKECLKIGKSITEILTNFWDIFQELGIVFKSQRQFLRICLNKNDFARIIPGFHLNKVKIWESILQKEIRRLSVQKKEIDSIVFSLYGIPQQDRGLIE